MLPTLPPVGLSAGTSQLAQCVGQLVEMLEAGKPVDLRKLVATCPENLEQLEALLPTLEAMVDLQHGLENPTTTEPSARSRAATHPAEGDKGGHVAGVLGDFRILSELGRGGMGVVYEAEQLSIGRRVALKVLPFAAMLDSRQLNRFKNEARAAGTLDHPNIVGIHSVGSDRGIHYYAMQLIEGISLAEMITELKPSRSPPVVETVRTAASAPADTAEVAQPTSRASNSAAFSTIPAFDSREYYRAIARLGIQAAEALDHAHQNGILHRDIKPANLLVDDTGNLWITDFGLARIEQDAGMTMTGDLLGTLRYMSPEQALAKRVVVDHRSDIYSLGVTLYELLTLQPAFTGSDRQELLRQIAFDEPRTPRQVNARIPQDLETIILKAIEKNPADRYATAHELADDVRRFLENQPIKAKPASYRQQLTKWSRRHVAVVWSALAASIMSTLILAGSTALIIRERNVAQVSAVEAEKERKRAQENLLKAKQAVDTWFTQVGEDLQGQPHMTNVSRALLEQALEFYQGFLKQKSNDPEIRYETALAYQRVISIHRQLGRDEECIEPSRAAVTILEKLSSEFPENAQYRDKLPELYAQLGLIYFYAGRTGEAAPQTQKALHAWEKLAHRFPSVPEYQRKVATTHVDLGNQLAVLPGKLDEAEEHCRESLVLWKRFREQFPDLTMGQYEEAHSHHWLAAVLSKAGRYKEVEHHLRLAVELKEKLVADSPKLVGPRDALAHAKIYLGKELLRKGLLQECETELRSAISLLQPLLDDFPDEHHYRHHLGLAYDELLSTLLAQRRYEEAEQAAREVIALQSSNDDIKGWPYYNLALVVHRRDRVQEAADLFRQAFQRFEKRAAKFPPDSTGHRTAQTALRWTLVTCPLPQFRDPPRALEIAKQLAQVDPLSADGWTDMGIAHYRLGEFDDAIEAIHTSNELRDGGDSINFYFLAMAHHRRGEQDEARQWYQRAIEHKQNIGGSNHADLLNFRDEAAKLLGIKQENEANTNGANGTINPDDYSEWAANYGATPPPPSTRSDCAECLARIDSQIPLYDSSSTH